MIVSAATNDEQAVVIPIRSDETTNAAERSFARVFEVEFCDCHITTIACRCCISDPLAEKGAAFE